MDKETKQEFTKLTLAIKKGFDGVDERFKKMEKDFDTTLDRKIGGLKNELKDYIDQKWRTEG